MDSPTLALLLTALAAGCAGAPVTRPAPPPGSGPPAPRVEPAARLAVGARHACLRRDGRVRCWGDNGSDQLGDGYLPYRTTPVRAPAIPDLAEVRLGGYTTCVRTTGGQVHCWGGGSATPARVPGIDDAVELAADELHACARRRGGRVWCWNQRAGEGTAPVLVPGVTDAVALVTPKCFLRRDGAVPCVDWDEPASAAGPSTRTPPLLDADRAALHAARPPALRETPNCARGPQGVVTCWDPPHRAAEVVPPRRPHRRPELAEAVDVAVGQRHTCALQRAGGVLCWGLNDHGQLGGEPGPEAARGELVKVVGLDDATAIAAGVNHTCARRADATVVCWGANYSGQLGDGTTTDRRAPAPVAGLRGATHILASGAHTCARTEDGALWCWGWGVSGQLGDVAVMPAEHAAPVTVAGAPDAVAIAAGASHTCVAGAEGKVACWGQVNSGHVTCEPVAGGGMECHGFGTSCGKIWDGRTEVRATPEILADVTGALALSARGDRTCARTADGATRCWAEPGRCAASGRVEARAITLPLGDAEEVALSTGFACARRGGAVLCGGSNRAGQLGDGTTTERATFAPVRGITDATGLAVGERHACARHATGTVSCWGFNVSGQLGDPTRVGRTVPAPVAGLSGVTAIAAGHWHTCAIRGAGSVVCWGENDAGSIGDGTTEDRFAPVAIGIDDAVEIAAAADSTCALRRSGTVSCWGPLAGPGALRPVDVPGL
jgi:alpha-tubulin suppressor-like RCC1 family protein